MTAPDDGGRNLGGREITYCKGELAASITTAVRNRTTAGRMR